LLLVVRSPPAGGSLCCLLGRANLIFILSRGWFFLFKKIGQSLRSYLKGDFKMYAASGITIYNFWPLLPRQSGAAPLLVCPPPFGRRA